MATLVCFHAHPDDEAIATGGTMAKAAAAGHRVVVVLATRGEQGEVVPGTLHPEEELGRRRVLETHEAAEVLGVDVVEFLGYRDSGMEGAPANADPDSFWRADVEEAAERLAAILRDVDADVLTVYDDHGTYGHPDHVQVHRVGVRAAALADVRVYEATMNRDSVRELMAQRAERVGDLPDVPADLDIETFGEPAERITHAIDVTDFVAQKRQAIACHATQVGPDDFFLAMNDDEFRAALGTEWFIRRDATRRAGEPFLTDLFE